MVLKKIFLFCAVVASLFCGTYQVDEIQEVEKHLLGDSKSVLVLFDVDYTLTHSKEPALQLKNINAHSSILKNLVASAEASKEAIENTFVSWGDHVAVEPGAPQLITSIKKRDIDVIAFTAARASVKSVRYASLKKAGFDFSKTFEGGNLTQPCCFFKGILFADGRSKGEVLHDFLKEMQLDKYKKVILVDDMEHNIKSVRAVLKERYPEIDFVGLHYKGAHSDDLPLIDAAKFRSVWESLIAATPG